AVYEVIAVDGGGKFEPWAKPGDRLVLAEKLAADTMKAAAVTEYRPIRSVSGVDLYGVVCAHPFRGMGYDFDVPLLEGDHVTDDAGTGFVNTAPSHGADDFNVWIARGMSQRDIPFTVDAEGRFTKEAPGFEGLEIIQLEGKNTGKDGPANKAVIDKLI